MTGCKSVIGPLWIPSVAIKARPTAVDAFGQAAESTSDIASWSAVCTVSGYRRDPKWNERVALQTTDRVAYVLETPWNAIPISAGMRAVIFGVVYEIQSVFDPDLRRITRNLMLLAIDEAV